MKSIIIRLPAQGQKVKKKKPRHWKTIVGSLMFGAGSTLAVMVFQEGIHMGGIPIIQWTGSIASALLGAGIALIIE